MKAMSAPMGDVTTTVPMAIWNIGKKRFLHEHHSARMDSFQLGPTSAQQNISTDLLVDHCSRLCSLNCPSVCMQRLSTASASPSRTVREVANRSAGTIALV